MSSRTQFWLTIAVLNGAIWLFAFRARPDAQGRARLEGSNQKNQAAAAAPRPVPSIVVRTNAFDWRQLESEDYRTYINRLRSIDCPEETIRDIVIADLEKLMAPDVQTAEGKREAPKYWEPK